MFEIGDGTLHLTTPELDLFDMVRTKRQLLIETVPHDFDFIDVCSSGKISVLFKDIFRPPKYSE